MKKAEETIMTSYDVARTMNPDYRLAYTYSAEPCARTSKYDEDHVDVTLQAIEKDSGIWRAHGYKVSRKTIDKIISDLEYDGNQESTDDLELCPFCKSSCETKRFDDGKWYVECIYCGTSTQPVFHTRSEAVKFWNERS